jgi:nitroreductase
MEFLNFLKSRRSVRGFKDYEVCDKEIEKIMEGASWAPSWMNTQCWEYIVVKDKEKIKEVANTYKLNPAYFCSRKASVIVLACAKKNLSGYLAGVKTTKIENWFMFDLGLSVQNLLLTVHSLGLGAVVVGAVDRIR